MRASRVRFLSTRRWLLGGLGVALAVTLSALPHARAEDAPGAAPREPLIHVPIEEIDVLLENGKKGVVLRYDAYQRLVAAAHARAAALAAEAPVDGALVSAAGVMDLRGESAELRFTHKAVTLGSGPRSVDFRSRGIAIEGLEIRRAEKGAGPVPGHYESKDGMPRLRFTEPGTYEVQWRGSCAFYRRGTSRHLDLFLPPAAALATEVVVPAGHEGSIQGEGAPQRIEPKPEVQRLSVVPQRGGRLRVTLRPASETEVGPPILDGTSTVVHTLGDGLVRVEAVLRADVFRTPTAELLLRLPASLAVHDLSGSGVVSHVRSEDRTTLRVRLAKPMRGRVELKLVGEQVLEGGEGLEGRERVALPRVYLADAARLRRVEIVQPRADVRLREVNAPRGRRLSLAQARARAGVFAFQVAGADAQITAKYEPTGSRVEATSTWYWNLGEAGKTLIATTTYEVKRGRVFTLRPKFPATYELRALSIHGKTTGFRRDRRPDGTVEIHLQEDIKQGERVPVVATLEEARTDWLPEDSKVRVSLTLPSTGADRSEALVAVGADAAFQVLEAGTVDLESVGAGDLTQAGISAEGLLYGYRVEGPGAALSYDVRRHEPYLEASAVSVLRPTPRRLEIRARAVHKIDRAGVREFFFDVPAWAGDEVRFETPLLRDANPLDEEALAALGLDAPPAGFRRWRVALKQRVIGTHVTSVSYHLDRAEDNWRVTPEQALALHIPVPRAERYLVVTRAEGLEVNWDVSGDDVHVVETSELPTEARPSSRGVLAAVRLTERAQGLGLGVIKHEGAAVLDAIATLVSLETAVSRSGVLRTRASVSLLNIHRQFLEVHLPERSALIGAVVNGIPVKPLRRGDHTLLVPVPTARAAGERAHAALTYETKLKGPLEGEVTIPAPEFPGLEVMHTVQVVGLEPDLVVTSVEGAFVGEELHDRPAPPPMLAQMFAGDADMASLGGPEPSSVGRSSDAGMFYSDTSRAGEPHALRTDSEAVEDGLATFERDASGARMRLANETEARRQMKELIDHEIVAEEPMLPGATTPVEDPAPRGAARQTDNGLPYEESLGESEGLSDAPFEGPSNNGTIGLGGGGGAAFAPRGAARGRPGAGGLPAPQPRADGDSSEGGVSPFERQQRALAARRRRGLLSLDVPVWLAPNRIVAERLGSGGEVVMHFESSEAPGRRRLLLTVLLLAAGFALTMRRGWRRLGIPVLAILAGIALRMATGTDTSLLATVLVDVGCVLLFAHGAYALLRRRAARRVGAVAVLVLAAITGGASLAHADEPRPDAPDLKPGAPLYVPYDREGEEGFDAEDQVFLPLETWQALYRAAHPDEDPEVIRLGRTVSVTESTGRLRIAASKAEVELRMTLAKRGEGTVLLTLPLAGLAITEATLGGKPVRLLLQKGKYLLALEQSGSQELRLVGHLPLITRGTGRVFAFETLPFPATRYDVRAPSFAGDIDVIGPGRVVVRTQGEGGFVGEAFPGAVRKMRFVLRTPRPDVLPETTVLRSDIDSLHTLRDDGTESRHLLHVRVLQGSAPFVDIDLDGSERVLEVRGGGVVRWQRRSDAPARIRLTFGQPLRDGDASITVRTVRLAEVAARPVTLGAPWLTGASGGRGRVVINAHPDARVRVSEDATYVRTARPRDEECRGPDRLGRVVGAWTYSARPRPLVLSLSRAVSRMRLTTVQAVAFGGDRVSSRFDALVRIERVALGELIFDLPGVDEVRSVQSTGLADWWLTGEGETRQLRLRYRDLVSGEVPVRLTMERDLDGRRDGLRVPRWALRGAQRDEGRLVLFALPDVEPAAGAVPGLQPLALERARVPTPPVFGGQPVNAFLYERPVADGLPVVLRTPELALSATVTSLVAPGVEQHQVEHLVLFEARRGATDVVRFFLPGAGHDDATVVRTRDLREMRKQTVTREGPGGTPVVGTQYELILQSKRGGLIEVACSQVQEAGRPTRFPQPLDVEEARWFAMVRTFIDGEVTVAPLEGTPELSAWSDLVFVPTGLTKASVVRIYDGREPFALRVDATSHPMEAEAEALILRAVADVALGRDGQARVRAHYRVFNRSRQFLRVRLPKDAVLFGTTAAGKPVKPLQGADATFLVPIPKVPLGGVGYPVTVLYRMRAGSRIQDGSKLRLELPEIPGLDVDRTAVRLLLPDRHGYSFKGALRTADAADVAADLALATLQEVRDLLKVARSGTLEQRVVSARNAQALLASARSVSAELRATPGQRDVGQQLDVLQAECMLVCGKAEADLATAGFGQQGLNPSQVQFGGNAAQLLALDEDADEEAPGNEPQMQGNWRYNGAPEAETAQREEIVQLKRSIQTQLRGRGGAARSRDRNVRQSASRALDKDVRQEMAGTKSKDAASTAAEYADAYNSNFVAGDDANVAWLNDQLRSAQEKNRQLGTTAGNKRVLSVTQGTDPAQARSGRVARGELVLEMSENIDAATIQDSTARLLVPSAGSGGGAAAWKDWGAADAASAASEFAAMNSVTSSGTSGGVARTGLMGVDVPLARVGTLYHFRGRDARVLEIEVEGEGSFAWARILILLLALGALGAGLWWGRRSASAA